MKPAARARILVSAFACRPGSDGESGAGWSWVRRIARRHDVWLLTSGSNAAAIEEAARAEGLTGLRVIAHDVPRWLGASRAWQFGAGLLARRLARQVHFDLVHHLTSSSSTVPSGLAFLGAPFLWGPIGRHPRVPDRFLKAAGPLARLREAARELRLQWIERCDPWLKLTGRRATRILARTPGVFAALPAELRAKAVVFPSAAVDPWVLPDSRWKRGEVWRVAFAGALDERSGVRLAIEAFGRLASREADVTLTVIGRGPLENHVRRRVRRLGLTRRVELLGALPRAETRLRLLDTDVFLCPSFEAGGARLFEAMSAGCAVVCLTHGDAGDWVAGGRGLAVPAGTTFEGTSAELTRALLRLHRDEPERRRLAEAGWWWASREQSWTAREDALTRLYDELLGRPAPLPLEPELAREPESVVPEPVERPEPAPSPGLSRSA